MSTMYVDNIAPLNGSNIDINATVTNSNRPAFLAGRTDNNYTSTVGTFQLNATKYNVGNVWDTTNYRFTAPVAGMYYFHGQIYYNSGAGYFRCQIRKNNSENICTSAHTFVGNDHANTISIIHYCNVGDTISLYSDQNASQTHYYALTSTAYGPHTYFMGYLLG